METSIRPQRISIINALRKHPFSFQFEMAAFILEANNKFSFGKEMSVSEAPFRTKNLNCFYLRGAEIDKIKMYKGKHLVYTQRLSISGLNAPLATPYSELILNRSVQKDDTMLDFLNVFNERLVGLSYQINKKKYPALQKHEGLSLFLKMLSALHGGEGNFNRRKSRLSYLFWNDIKSAAGLEAVAAAFLNTKVKAYECRTIKIEKEGVLPLARHNLRLGVNSELGKKVFLSDFALDLVVKNYDYKSLIKIVTDDSRLYELKKAIRDYIGDFVFCKMLIEPETAPALRLKGVLLKKNSWLPSKKHLDPIQFQI